MKKRYTHLTELVVAIASDESFIQKEAHTHLTEEVVASDESFIQTTAIDLFSGKGDS